MKYRTRGKYYETKARNMRPTRNAAGMMNTRDRSNHNFSDDARTLAVRGTLDKLSDAYAYVTTLSGRKCTCCGQKMNARVLTDAGRRRLAGLRRRLAREKGTGKD